VQQADALEMSPAAQRELSDALLRENGAHRLARRLTLLLLCMDPLCLSACSPTSTTWDVSRARNTGFRSTRRTKLVCTIGPASCSYEVRDGALHDACTSGATRLCLCRCLPYPQACTAAALASRF
jgi:hypothetical protein